MNKAIEQSRGRQILLALAVWIGTASVLTAVGALFVSRMRLPEQRLGWVAGGIVLIAEFTAAAALLRGRTGKRRLISALLFWVVSAAVLLTLGFLIYGEHMRLTGLCRLLACSFAGALLSCLFASVRKQRGSRATFMRGK